MSLLTPDFGLLFWMLLSFGIVVFILTKYGFPVIVAMVEERKKYIDDSLLQADKARKELENVKANSMKILDEARKEQSLILAEAAKHRDMIVENAKKQASEEATKILAEAKEKIQLEKEDAIRSIRREVAVLSVGIAEKIVRQRLESTDEQVKMIDRLLDDVNIPQN